MKKCPKCDIEYDDSDSFCPVCGGKLIPVDACPSCGQPINVNDVFCRHCGCRIEKEYRCKKCNAVIPENSKFCPECGEKIVDPVVSVPANNVSTGKGFDRTFVKKLLFFAGHAVLFVLLILMFVGCFGDIYKTESTPGLGLSNSETTIAYFFGEAVDNIKAATASDTRNDYQSFLAMMLVFEYINWFFALGTILSGLIIGLVGLFKGATKKAYSFNNKPYLVALLGALPYVFIFGVKYSGDISGYTSYTSYYSTTTSTFYTKQIFGWGTTMILVCSAIGICLMSLLRIGVSVIEKDSFVKEIASACFKLTFYFIFVFSLFRMVDIRYLQSNVSIKGYFSAYEGYTTALASYSRQIGNTIQTIDDGAVNCLISTILLYSGGIVCVALFGGLFEAKKFDFVFVVGQILVLVLYITGFALARNGFSEYATKVYAGLIPEESFKYSPMGIVMPVITTLCIIGFGVTSFIKTKQQQVKQ